MLREASAQRIKLVTMTAFISVPLSGFVTDIYLPSFPAMAKEMMVQEKNIQTTLTAYLLSYGITQLFVGGIVDSIGRYRPKLLSLLVLVVTNVLITMTDSIFLICVLRAVQGMAVSLLVVATRAIFVDLYDLDKAKHYLSYFTIVWSLGPILAPFLGGYLEKLFNWHANFHFLAIYAGFLLLFEIFFSGESIYQKKRFSLSENIALYRSMLKNRRFVLGIFILGLSYSIVLIFNITGPFIIENTFHFNSVVIGYCTLILGFSWMIGGFIGKRVMQKSFNTRVLWPVICQMLLIILLLATSYFVENIFIMVGFAFIIHIFSGVLYTSFFANSILYFPKNTGAAGGLMGGLIYMLTSSTSFIISITGTITQQKELAWRYLLICLLLFGIILLLRKVLNKEQNNHTALHMS